MLKTGSIMSLSPCLLASTEDIYSKCSIIESWKREKYPTSEISSDLLASRNNVFKTCQWTPDGTSLISTSEDQVLRLFVA